MSTLRGCEGRIQRRRQRVWERQLSRGELKHPISDYQTRLVNEIAMIKQMGFAGYFLIVFGTLSATPESMRFRWGRAVALSRIAGRLLPRNN